MRVALVLVAACSRQSAPVVLDASPPPVVLDASPVASTKPRPASLEEACKRHDDCVALELFVDGPLRCCISCGARAAANRASASAFIAACADERPTRDCPVDTCDAEVLDARCVGGHCQLAPRPR